MNKHHDLTSTGVRLGEEVRRVVYGVFSAYKDGGYDFLEISHIISRYSAECVRDCVTMYSIQSENAEKEEERRKKKNDNQTIPS